ncbi:MAG: sulfatase, partial [Pseudomonadota bacterium]
MIFRVCLSFFLLALSSLVTGVRAQEPDRPNILWLSTEDIGPHLGCYGYDVKTPNIDQFAKRSLTFDTAWSNYPVCAPARTTIITGMYATALGAGNMRCGAIKPTGLKLLPELMREAGYYCTNASKTDYNLLDVNGVWDESSGKAHWRNRPSNKPFFSVFNYTKTHESKIRIRPHEKQIDPASVSLFPYWPDTPEVRQDWAQYLDNIQTMDGWFQKHLDQIENAGLQEDTIVVFWGDHGSGMPRHKRLAGDSGMRVPMIVHVPEKWKQFWNSNYAAGGRSDWPVGFIDLAPTVLQIAGAAVPDRMQGSSFLGAEAKRADYLFGVRNRMDERYDVSRSVTDGRYVYIRNFMPYLPHGQFVEYQQTTPSTSIWYKKYKAGQLNPIESAFWKPHPAEELFDLKKDPHETVNLAMVPELKSKLEELRDVVRQKMIAIGDLDLVPESTLYEFEQRTGKSRTLYSEQENYSTEQL